MENIETVEVNYIYPGCAPEHFRDRIAVVYAPALVDVLLKQVARGAEGSSKDGEVDGGVATEFIFHAKDGTSEKIIQPGCCKIQLAL